MFGVAVPAADDWNLQQVTWIFSVAILCLGLTAAYAGRWLEQVGPRMVGIVAAVCWGGGYLVGSLGFAATYVSMISVFNMLGRLFWASASDYIIGRKNTYTIFFVLGIVLYLTVPFAAQRVSADPAVVHLVLFYGATMIIFTMYGGGFSTIPAYLADVFGTKYVGGIHGRILTAWSIAGVLGPLAITSLRESAVNRAINDLASRVDTAAFRERFGAGLDQLNQLVEAQTVTIGRLMEIMPPDTVDPTPGLYSTTMYLMAFLLALALISNALMRPVHPKRHMREQGGAS